ncbi:tripartite tricarboxylate transporter substrate binding protein [Amphritea pacifica]|uniref:Tripartite tricarboxylate transporter substrate binding protein n=1 Tax=Amphritea pacifica TaxID=2811233 RepID=A0ABS2WA02_9GAMM|nr:tripartite tricarboxylate transporter substrate binding protein [Amphritea pacifica]MBN0988547.1 tripartite tricarboxylate transporter substrate binding protein [Amphritea pacifica]MBN1006755.1 tripartite tricarboxylate transporter substrate binding protein [Amphritea pacifica]
MKKIIKICTLAALATAPFMGSVADASDYPNRPVKFVVPWPPGDLEDILTRMIAEDMAKETGKPATVVNKPGGAGIVGASEVARARADGLTIGSFVIDILTTHLLSGNAPYDKDTFEPVGIFLDYPFVLATKADSRYNNIEELAEYSQTHDVSLGHFGYQALPTAVTFKAAAQEGIKFSSNAAFDLLDCSTLANGDADVINTTTQLILSCLQSGEVKLLASLTRSRLSIAPDVPTLNEQTGISQTTWNGLFVKKGTPEEVKQRIGEIAEKALSSDRVKEISNTTGAGIYWLGGKFAEEVVASDYEASKSLLEYMKE